MFPGFSNAFVLPMSIPLYVVHSDLLEWASERLTESDDLSPSEGRKLTNSEEST